MVPTVRVARSLFNYLVPMLQDKQAKEEERKGGQQAELNRPKRGCPASGLGSCGVASGVA